MYSVDIANTYTECFVLKFLDIPYCLYWCKAYETVLGKSCKKLGLFCFYFSTTATAEDVCNSQCKIEVTLDIILTKKL